MSGGRAVRQEIAGQNAGIFAVVFIAYSLGAVLAWKAFGSAFGPAFFYPPAGLTAATMMLTARSRWPGIVAAIVLGEMMVDVWFGNTTAVAAGYAGANVAEPLVGASIALAWCRGTPDLRRRRDLVAFIAAACMLGPVAGGVIGGTTTHFFDGSVWITDVLHWWIGDALGVLVVATPILLWAKQFYILRARAWEATAALGLTAIAGVAAFWSESPPSTLILPPLAWAALRLDMLGASLAGAITAFVATIMTSRGHGIFNSSDLSPGDQLAVTQLFVAVVVIVALLVAQEAAARIRAVRQHQTERRERIRLEGLSDLAQQLSASLTPADIGRALEEHVLNEAGAKALSLGLITPDGRRLEWVTMAGYPRPIADEFGQGVSLAENFVATDAVRTGAPVVIGSARDYARRYWSKVRWMQMNSAASMAAWPLAGGGRPFGSLALMWEEPQSFDGAQTAYISAIATMVSQALVRARVYADEHARAAVLQSALLPENPGHSAGLEVHVAYEPADIAEGLGGDWYDVMSLPKGMTYFAVGDVIGHGLPAVEDMAQLRSAGRALAHQGLGPGRLLAELNGFTRHASQGKFATMAVAVFDPQTRVLTYSTAGHPPPLLRRTGGDVLRLSQSGGAVLGPLAETTYTESTVVVDPGDVLVMYTDGLVERRGSDVESGIAAAERIVATWRPIDDVAHGCEELYGTLAPRPRSDDLCVIVVRFL